MIIREHSAGDAAAITALCVQLGYPVTEAEVRARLPDAEGVVAELGGQIVGWMQLERRALVTTGPIAEVSALVVDEAARGTGVGRRLLEHAEAWASAAGLARVRIRCNTTRVDTHRFYEGRGYRAIKTQTVFDREPRP